MNLAEHLYYLFEIEWINVVKLTSTVYHELRGQNTSILMLSNLSAVIVLQKSFA